MSQRLISLNEDLSQLRQEGYDLEVRHSYLLVKDVPYVTANCMVERGVLVSSLELEGDATKHPVPDHMMRFIGEYPCDKNGNPLEQLRHSDGGPLANDLIVNFAFSHKLFGGVSYPDYYKKVTSYVRILENQAQAIDPGVTARTHPVILPDEDDNSVFNYLDSASGRAGIVATNQKLELEGVAIVGLGGTGSYVLDLIAKTYVREIHLFDRDSFDTHNAFRAPGAASIEELNAHPTKVEYLHDRYAPMRKGIVAHPYHVDEETIHELLEMKFVFVCIDASASKEVIVDKLEEAKVPFIDVGMGIKLRDSGSLGGILRATLNEPGRSEAFRRRVSLGDSGRDPDYEQNIQVADLNALNAAMAVFRWKQYFGFYSDYMDAAHITLTLDTNMLLNEETK